MVACMLLHYMWLSWACERKVCYEDIGCFDNKPPFHKADFALPQSPGDLQVSFLLHTVKNPDKTQSITNNASQFEMTEFSRKRRTIFLIHGYRQGPNANWIVATKDAILNVEDANVIIVDWEKGAAGDAFNLGNYYQCAANTRVVGALLAKVMTFLFTSAGAKYEDMYVVGFSLGAHVAGFAGERISNLGRITGLDPAYQAFAGDETATRLDRTDAKYVDIIHTDGKQWISGLAISRSIGHSDFFPNGGLVQPDCEYWSLFMQSSCDHNRATKYFIESFNRKCDFKAVPCESWQKFKDGKCSCDKNCARMGFFGKPTNVTGNYYMDTDNMDLLCRE